DRGPLRGPRSLKRRDLMIGAADYRHTGGFRLSAGADRHLAGAPPAHGIAGAARRATRFDQLVVVSHWSSLRLQRVVAGRADRVDVTVVGRDARPRAVGIRGHRCQALDPADVVVVGGVPSTSVARGLIDVAPGAPPGRLRRAVREAQVLGLLSAADLAAACARVPWHPGVRALTACDGDLAVRLAGDSPLAGDLAVFLEHETALGPWESQHPLVARGRDYRLDFARPDLGIAVEADGAGAHGSSQGRTADARRDAAVLSLGWVTVRVTKDRLDHEPDDLRSALHAIAAGRGWPGPPDRWQPRCTRRRGSAPR
ncbi:DUF559 domain-containing protein, partial [Patulibacter sp. NPDC049589]|uniref:DUF559 domain-containing protein n=1 Tax=Patulibacter sp. NPDC049589 TaxID=3154731 RepID=UPI00343C0343